MYNIIKEDDFVYLVVIWTETKNAKSKKQVTQKNQDFVFDNTANGKNVDEILKEQNFEEKKFNDLNKSLELSRLEMQTNFLKIVQENNDKKIISNRERAEKIRQAIEVDLIQELGVQKAKALSKQFLEDVRQSNVKKASENLVKNVENAGKKFSGVQINTFQSKRVSSLKYDKDARLKQMLLSGKIAKKSISDASLKIQKTSNTSKLLSEHLKLVNKKNAVIRQMRRNARYLKFRIARMVEISNANNGIAFDKLGMESAVFAKDKINYIMSLLGNDENSSVSSLKAGDLNLDALLQKGRANMMQARSKINGLSKHLIRQRGRDERVRS